MLSWSTESLLIDGRGQGELRQGVTLEVMGEGFSMGPLTPQMKEDILAQQGDLKYPIEWTTLGEYLELLEKKGVSMNVASLVGAATRASCSSAQDDVDPTPEQLAAMQDVVQQAMEEGALGVGSSLIYVPATFAETDELVALASTAARCGGIYMTHMRSEGAGLLEAVDETIDISRRSGAPAEIYHLKAAGSGTGRRWTRRSRGSRPRARPGVRITADMYAYPAGATGLDAAMPPWVQAGGNEAWFERLRDPAIRKRVAAEMRAEPAGWENLMRAAGGAENVLIVELRDPELKQVHRQDARGDREAARHQPGGSRDGPRRGGRDAGRHRLFPDVRGRSAAQGRAAVHELRFGRLGAVHGRRVPEERRAPARLRQFRAHARPLRARREADHPRGRDPPADLAPGSGAQPAATAAA